MLGEKGTKIVESRDRIVLRSRKAMVMLVTEEDVPWFRELYFDLLGYRGDSLYESKLKPWVDHGRAAMANAACFRSAEQFDTSSDDFLLPNWNVYALSRINDFLLLSVRDE